MVSLTTHDPGKPSALLRAWTLVLMAPVAWAGSLGLLFSLTDEACTSGSRAMMWRVATACLALTLAPAVLAWRARREIPTNSDAGHRARFMMSVAIGASLLFAVITLLSAAPIGWLDTCRT